MKHPKYTQQYFNKIKSLIPKKTTQKNKEGKLIDKPEIELLSEKRLELDQQIQTLDQEIRTGKGKTEKAQNVYKGYKYLKRRRDDLRDNAANYHSTALHNAGTNNFGWDAKMNNHFAKDSGVTGKDNLYQLTANSTNYEITEEQIISVIAQICKGLSTIDQTELVNKFNAWDTNATNQANMNNALTRLIADGKEVRGIANKHQTSEWKVCDFAYTFTQDNNAAYAGSRTVDNIITDFYNWLNLVSGKKNNKTLAETLTKDNTHSETIPIYGKGDEWNTKKLEDDFGIKINPATQHLYKSTINGKPNKVVDFSVKGGIGGWIELGETVKDTAGGNRQKLINSFTANAPITNVVPNQDLFNNLRTNIATWDENHKTWQFDGTNYCGLEFTGNLESVNEVLDELKVQKDLEVQEVVLTNREIGKKQTEKVAKETERNNLDAKIQQLITEELTNRRTTLTNYKITDGFEDKSNETNGKDNRRTSDELVKIKELLEDIRFLENADTSQNSSNAEENTAYTKLETLLSDYQNSKLFKFILAEGSTNEDKCKKIKETSDLQAYHDDYEKWDKLIKFSERQRAELQSISKALGKQEDPNENLQTYQTELKKLDPVLETVITQAIVDDWRTQNNFKTSETMKKELAKVLENGKLKATFKTVMTKADSEITDLAKLLQKKKAKEIITMIRRWEYDQEADSKKGKTAKVIKMNMNRKPEDANPTDEEITKGLYKLAVGEYSQKSEAEIKSWESGTEDNQNPKQKFFRMNNPWMWGGIVGIAVLVAAAVYYFWRESQKEKSEELGGRVEEREEDDKE